MQPSGGRKPHLEREEYHGLQGGINQLYREDHGRSRSEAALFHRKKGGQGEQVRAQTQGPRYAFFRSAR